MASVFKSNGASKYTIVWTDENGRRRKKTGCTDKAESLRIGNDLENRKALRRAGLVDPKSESYRDHEAKLLVRHLADFQAALSAKGGTERHAKVTAYRAGRVLELAKARRISDLSLSKTLTALASLRSKEDLSQETINHHVRAVKAFSRWLWKDGRAREHHLAHLATSNPEADRRRRRRALTHEEAARLVRTAENGPVVMEMTGPDRAMLYALALGTGFRADELATLTPDRFDLASNPPTATVDACYSKNGREAVQPLPQSLADRLGPWLALRPAGRPVFDGMTKRTAEMLRVDLEAAGIPYETSAGVIDFHALRGTYISHLVSSGASVKTCQTLARHSTPSLTIGVYAKASLHDIAGAVEALPDLGVTRHPTSEAAAATGTDGRFVPSATECATVHFENSTQVHGEEADWSFPAEDLKSVSWHSDARRLERQGIPREFVTRSRLAVISNDWKTLNKNVAALQDRGPVVVFDPSAAEVHATHRRGGGSMTRRFTNASPPT